MFSLIVGYSAGKNKQKKKTEKEIAKLILEKEMLENPNLIDDELKKNLGTETTVNRFFKRIWDWIKL
jgi:hypothetical protein